MLVVLLHARFSVVGPILFLLAAIFFPGHAYIGSTTILPDYVFQVHSMGNTEYGMGNSDTLHPNSCFCSFSIPTFKNKILVTSLSCFYAHAHEITPTSIYKLSHNHIIVEDGPWLCLLW